MPMKHLLLYVVESVVNIAVMNARTFDMKQLGVDPPGGYGDEYAFSPYLCR